MFQAPAPRADGILALSHTDPGCRKYCIGYVIVLYAPHAPHAPNSSPVASIFFIPMRFKLTTHLRSQLEMVLVPVSEGDQDLAPYRVFHFNATSIHS